MQVPRPDITFYSFSLTFSAVHIFPSQCSSLHLSLNAAPTQRHTSPWWIWRWCYNVHSLGNRECPPADHRSLTTTSSLFVIKLLTSSYMHTSTHTLVSYPPQPLHSPVGRSVQRSHGQLSIRPSVRSLVRPLIPPTHTDDYNTAIHSIHWVDWWLCLV